MIESKYLEKFSKLNADTFPLRGNRMLVEVLPKEEIKSKGGILLHSDSNTRTSTEQNRGTVAIVLAVGNGYFEERVNEETGDFENVNIPLEFQPGSVVLCSDQSFRYYSKFPGFNEYTGETIAMTRDTEVHITWPSLAAYNAYQEIINS